jgi:mono/diheme cytochrome c family protein
MRRFITSCFGLSLTLATAVSAQESSTWQVIQHNILGQNCSSCHQSGSPFARQSGLELTGDQTYDQLVNALPTNRRAERWTSCGAVPRTGDTT